MEKLIIVLLCASTLSSASLKARMPLLTNNLRSNLIAELDVSDVNKQIKEYIDRNLENEVNDTFLAQIENIVNNKISELKAEMLKDFPKEWRENVVKETKEMRTELDEIKKPVAVTSCVTNGVTISSDAVIKFDDFVTQIGFSGVSAFSTTGKFTCEKAGLYLISVHIMSTASAWYSIRKNSNILSRVYIGHHPTYSWDYTGTGTVTVELQSGDQVWVQTASSFFVQGDRWACISVVKLK